MSTPPSLPPVNTGLLHIFTQPTPSPISAVTDQNWSTPAAVPHHSTIGTHTTSVTGVIETAQRISFSGFAPALTPSALHTPSSRESYSLLDSNATRERPDVDDDNAAALEDDEEDSDDTFDEQVVRSTSDTLRTERGSLRELVQKRKNSTSSNGKSESDRTMTIASATLGEKSRVLPTAGETSATPTVKEKKAKDYFPFQITTSPPQMRARTLTAITPSSKQMPSSLLFSQPTSDGISDRDVKIPSPTAKPTLPNDDHRQSISSKSHKRRFSVNGITTEMRNILDMHLNDLAKQDSVTPSLKMDIKTDVDTARSDKSTSKSLAPTSHTTSSSSTPSLAATPLTIDTDTDSNRGSIIEGSSASPSTNTRVQAINEAIRREDKQSTFLEKVKESWSDLTKGTANQRKDLLIKRIKENKFANLHPSDFRTKQLLDAMAVTELTAHHITGLQTLHLEKLDAIKLDAFLDKFKSNTFLVSVLNTLAPKMFVAENVLFSYRAKQFLNDARRKAFLAVFESHRNDKNIPKKLTKLHKTLEENPRANIPHNLFAKPKYAAFSKEFEAEIINAKRRIFNKIYDRFISEGKDAKYQVNLNFENAEALKKIKESVTKSPNFNIPETVFTDSIAEIDGLLNLNFQDIVLPIKIIVEELIK